MTLAHFNPGISLCQLWRVGRILGLLGGAFALNATRLPAQHLPAEVPNVRLSLGGAVYSMAAQADGKVILGGQFTSVNGLSRNSVARLNRDGSVDIAWDPDVRLGAAPGSGTVDALAVDGTHVYIGGMFNSVGGQARVGFARVDLIFGHVDATWNPAVQDVHDLAFFGTDLFVAGTLCSTSCRQGVVKLSTLGTGTVDPAWDPDAQGPFLNAVEAVAVEGTNVFVGGTFTSIGGRNISRLAKVSALGSGDVDDSWRPEPDDTVLRLVVDAGGLYVGGAFGMVGGAPRNLIARVSTTGTGALDLDWNPDVTGQYVGALAVSQSAVFIGGVFDVVGLVARDGVVRVSRTGSGLVETAWDGRLGVGSAVQAMALTADGLTVGGNFAHANGTLALAVARLDVTTGIRNALFPAQVEQPGVVNALARQPDGKLIVGGHFLLADGLPRPNLLRLNADATLDSGWNPAPNAEVLGLGVNDSALVVCGLFTAIGGQARHYLAKFPLRNSDAADEWWDPGPNAGGFVRGLALKGSNVWVWGDFTQIGGQARAGLARLSVAGQGLADGSWNPTPDGPVNSVGTDGTNLFVAGLFSQIGGRQRGGFAKLSVAGTGAADASWDPAPLPAPGPGTPYTPLVALAGSELFVTGTFTNLGGQPRTNLAKLGTEGTGRAEGNWNPHPLDATLSIPRGGEVLALAVSDTDVFVAGRFDSAGGQARAGLAKLSRTGTGAADPLWEHAVAAGSIKTLLALGTDLHAGGAFDRVDELTRYGLAFLPVADPPVLIVEPGPRLVILRHPTDGPEVTHFQIRSQTGGALLRADGSTRLGAGDLVGVLEAASGFQVVFEQATATFSIASALSASPAGVGAIASTLTLTNGAPVTVPLSVSFDQASYAVKEGTPSLSVLVRKRGTGPASVRYTTVDGTALAGTDYQGRAGLLSFSAAETVKSIPIGIGNDFTNNGDGVFQVRLFSATNAYVREPGVTTITILEDDAGGPTGSCLTTAPPASRPRSDGALQVMLGPAEARGRWRLAGTMDWLESGGIVTGLRAANYTIEYLPVAGFLEPGNAELPIDVGVTNGHSDVYVPLPGVGTGELVVVLDPPNVATNSDPAQRGQWRLQGESLWHDSGERLDGLGGGLHLIEFKPVPDHAVPPPRICGVAQAQESIATATYLYALDSGGETPEALSLVEATESAPFFYNGQIRTALGFGSGVVVKERVVLTGAHVLFDDRQLSYVTDVKWLFQRHRGDHEPPAQTPRGWYVFGGYAAQRQLDNSPGLSTPDSQQLDVAALYFVETPTDPNLPGRGGFGGFLVSESAPSEWLLGDRLTMLAGYPVERVAETNRGRLHASRPLTVAFDNLYGQVYTTTQLRGLPGNSGGPLYVQHDNGTFYPAAIYLGGLAETIVRAIDADVADLINRAELSGHGGANNTGGGVALWSPGVTTSLFSPGMLGVTLGPAEAVHAGGAWRVRRAANDYSDYFSGSELIYPTVAGPLPVEFRPVSGFITPPLQLVQVFANQTNRIAVDYVPFRLFTSNLLSGGIDVTFLGQTGRVYSIEASTNARQWSVAITRTNTDGWFHYRDFPATNASPRFYRAVEWGGQ